MGNFVGTKQRRFAKTTSLQKRVQELKQEKVVDFEYNQETDSF